jgi:Rrf2 family cysteine metabolism transcriptional repressor
MRSKAEYALVAAIDLAANYAPNKPVKVRDVAARTGAPPKYLEQILLRLKTRALVRSTQGPTGGYCLMRRPALISAAEVLEAVTAAEDGRQRRPLPRTRYSDALDWLGARIERARREVLSQITLEELAARSSAETPSEPSSI